MATGASSGRVTPPSSSEQEVGCDDRHRFQLELEFVQCLANPHYINWLAQNRYLDDPDFLAYLTYLRYWKRPEYAQFIIYPSCLHFLDLLQQKEFRTNIANTAVKETVHTQQFRFWQFGRVNRMKEQQQLRQQAEEQQQQEQRT